MRALINEKDVSTDWLEYVYDNENVVRNGCKVVGFVGKEVVLATFSPTLNVIHWEFNTKGTDTARELRKRLEDFEKEDDEQSIYSTIADVKDGLMQKFYFKDEMI